MATVPTDAITSKTFFLPPTQVAEPALSPDEYEHRFLEVIAETVRAFKPDNQPLPDEVLGDPARASRYFAVEGLTHSFFAKVFPSCLMNVAAKCPYQEVRREIIEDCYCEEVNDPDAGDICHVEILYRDAQALGMSREEVEAFEPTPVIMACVHALDNLTKILPWEAGYAATGGMEALRVAIKRDYLTGGEYFGRYREDDIERICGIQQGILQQKRLHNYKDQLHGGGCLRILRQYVTSREMQEQTFWATRLSRQLRVITQREQRRMARAAVGLPADNLFVG